MDIVTDRREDIVIFRISGRLDAFGAKVFQEKIDSATANGLLYAAVDMGGSDYLSSAGLRVLLACYQQLTKKGGGLAIAGLNPYCRNVLDMAGFTSAFPIFDSSERAFMYCTELARERDILKNWDELEVITTGHGTLRVIPGSTDACTAKVLGHINDVLYARITAGQLCSKRFSEAEYSIGLGGLGDKVDDYLGIMGEMITIGGTMVWLPTDGHDTPDFLIPKSDKGGVMLRTGFNVSLAGHFNELMLFESNEEGGTSITDLYRELFNAARRRRKDFKGVLGLALRAEMGSVFGSGVKKSPVAYNAPADKEMITHPSHISEWFDTDMEPRHKDATCLICGIGADLSAELSAYDKDELESVFYLHPANTGGKTELLHNHAVIFSQLPMPERVASMAREIRNVVSKGDFLDMRHLLDSSSIKRAFIGIAYVEQFMRDEEDQGGASPEIHS